MLEGRWFVAAFALGMLITALVWAHLRDHERDLEKAHHAAAADRLVQALAQAMLDAARAVPGFVQLDSTESNR